MDEDEKLEYYLSIGAINLEGIDENGEVIYSISDTAKDLAPELWQSHEEYVDKTLLDLYNKGLLEVEYDENLEATIKLNEEGYLHAKQYGIIPMEFDEDIPND
jgi:hypothetical protein